MAKIFLFLFLLTIARVWLWPDFRGDSITKVLVVEWQPITIFPDRKFFPRTDTSSGLSGPSRGFNKTFTGSQSISE